jgi:hypothetical protein
MRDDEEQDHTINDYMTHNERRPKEDGAASSSLWFKSQYFRNRPTLVSVHQMVSHTLRNRTAEPSEQNNVFTSQMGECDWPHDQPEQSDNDTEIDETIQLSLVEENRVIDSEAQVTQANEMTNGKVDSEKPNVDNTNEQCWPVSWLP